jgi:MerR family redox-sensitive transcriptional activator SoxR
VRKTDLLSIGEVARRSGVSVPTVRFYEAEGLIDSVRTAGNQRRFAMVRAGQRFGLPLAEIRAALASLPMDRPPTKRDWAKVARGWHDRLTAQIEALTEVRDKVTSCIGCGCLSLAACPIYNLQDELAADGPGARRLPAAARSGG